MLSSAGFVPKRQPHPKDNSEISPGHALQNATRHKNPAQKNRGHVNRLTFPRVYNGRRPPDASASGRLRATVTYTVTYSLSILARLVIRS